MLIFCLFTFCHTISTIHLFQPEIPEVSTPKTYIMTRRQAAQLDMYVIVSDLVKTTNTETLGLMPTAAEKLTTLGTIARTIDTIGGEQQLYRYSARPDKDSARETLISRILRIDRSIKAHAVSEKNETLKQQFGHSETALRRLSDHDLMGHAEMAHNFAYANQKTIEPYNCTAIDIAALLEATEGYRAAAIAPRQKTVNSTDTTRKLKILYKQGSALLKDVDVLVETLIGIDDDFVALYRRSRVIIEKPARTVSISGQVIDAIGNPMSHVSVKIDGLKRNSKTSKKGSFRFIGLPDGTYTLLFSRTGFKDLTEIVHVTKGLRKTIRVELREA